MAENETVTSNRERTLGRLRERYPERTFDDDEAAYGQIYDDYEQYEQELGGYRDREQKLYDAIGHDPRTAQFLADMSSGGSPWSSYIRIFGPELKDSIDDPETAEKIAEAEAEYVARVAENNRLEEEYKRNMEGTLEMLGRYREERGLGEEQVDAILAVLRGIIRDGIQGKVSAETLDMVSKAMSHDADVAAAAEEGEVAGRNAKISEQLRRGSQGDGVASLAGKNGGESGRGRGNMFDLASEAM